MERAAKLGQSGKQPEQWFLPEMITVSGDRGPDAVWDDVGPRLNALGLGSQPQMACTCPLAGSWSQKFSDPKSSDGLAVAGKPASWPHAQSVDDLDALFAWHRRELSEMLELHRRMVSSTSFLALAAQKICVARTRSHEDLSGAGRNEGAVPSCTEPTSMEAVKLVHDGGSGDVQLNILTEGDVNRDPFNDTEKSYASFQSRDDVPKIIAELQLILSWLPDNSVVRAATGWVQWLAEIKEPKRDSRLARFISHQFFESGCLCVIMLNAFFSAFVVDHEIKHLDEELTREIVALEWAFAVFYVMELGVKIVVHGQYFLWSVDWKWNCFDLLLVVLSVQERITAMVVSGNSGNVSFMRIFRLLKLTKVARLFRVLKFFRELRLMLLSMKASVSSLFWAMIMLSFIFYIFGLILLQGITGLLLEDQRVELREMVEGKFDSLPGTLISLYMISTGGTEWGPYYEVVSEAGWAYGMVFLVYVAFFIFSVTNILTGIIVEQVVNVAKEDTETMLFEYRARCNGEIAEIQALFKALDVDRDGIISLLEWDLGLAQESVRVQMAAVELCINDADVFFEQLQAMSKTKEVDIGTFVNGCLKMRGQASSLDMQLVAFQGQVIQNNLSEIIFQLGKLGEELTEPMHSMSSSRRNLNRQSTI